MTSTLPPDPYLALGVPKDAPAATIKSTYRKLVLKCHPDKVTDESLKKQKQEEFHKIQQAYELIGDEDKRATYDAEVKLDQLRKEKLARATGASHVEVKTARYDVRTAAPGGATFTANGPHRYEKREPTSRSYDDYYEQRKYDTYEAYPKHSSSTRTARPKEEPIRVARVSSDRTRSERNRARDRAEHRERSNKFVYIDDDSSSSDEKARYEADYRRRSDEERRRREEEEARKIAADARRKAEDRRSYEDPKEPRRHRSGEDRDFERQRKLSDQENDAVRYIHRSKVESDPRPSPGRTSSSRDVRPENYDSRSARRDRPEAIRRSSAARPKDRPQSSGRESLRDRKGIPEIVEWDDDRKAPPSFTKSTSSPADLHVPPRTTPQRSYTESSRDHHRRTETSPPPAFRRSETMPNHPTHPSSSSRRKESTAPRPSGLRTSESASPNEPEKFPTVPPPRTTSSSTKYYYSTPGGGVSLRPEDVGVANGHRTILREPERYRARSPSPLSRPPIGPNRPVETAPSTARAASSTIPPPPLGRSATFNATSPVRGEERGRSQRLFREIPSEYTRRENARRQTSFSPDSISYARPIGPEDIRWAPRGREHERDREYARPAFGRSETVY